MGSHRISPAVPATAGRRARVIPFALAVVWNCCALPFLLLACSTVEEQLPAGPFETIKSFSQVDEDIILPPGASISDTPTSWMKKADGARSCKIFVRGSFSAQEMAAFYAVHMRIALWSPDGSPEKTASGWILRFGKDNEKCVVTVPAQGNEAGIEVMPAGAKKQ